MVTISGIAFAFLLAVAAGANPASQTVKTQVMTDGRGIAVYDYGGQTGKVYNPKVVALEGLKSYNDYIATGNEESKQKFLAAAGWLLDNAVDMGNYSLWQYSFDWPHYSGFKAPYSSALAQARGIVLLTKAHQATGNDTYLEGAKKAFGAFLVDYDDGGVASREGDGSVFFQILAKPGAPKTYVLNSHTKSLLLIREYYDYTNDSRAPAVFDSGMDWLVQNIARYDTGSWSYYDLLGTVSSDSYHRGQTKQLAELAELTGEPVLKEYSDLFAQYKIGL